MQGVSNASAQELPCFLCALHHTSRYWQFIKLDSSGKRRNHKTQKSLVKTSCKLLPLMLLYHVCPPRQAFLLEKFSLFASFSGNTFYFMPRSGRRGFSLSRVRPKEKSCRATRAAKKLARLSPHQLLSITLLFYYKTDYLNRPSSRPPLAARTGANTRDTMVISLIRMFIAGPEVSLNGSPTVSPTTVAS